MSYLATHPEYDLALTRWKRNRDAVAGNDAVKGRGYLRTLADDDAGRQQEYEEGAYFIEIPGYTVSSLTGMVFQKPATVDLPALMEDYADNVDGAGQSLEQFAKAALQDLFTVGRYGILIDYPYFEGTPSREQQDRLRLRPMMLAYAAEAIDNWRESTIGGRKTLTMVKLREWRDTPKDEFDHTTELTYRVLRLEDGVYTQELVSEEGEEIEPRRVIRANGRPLDHIPFYFAGSENNLTDVDRAPITGICELALKQYRNIADDEEAGFTVGQPMLHLDIGDTNAEFWKQENPNGIMFGSRKGVVTQGGKAELVQMSDVTHPGTLKQQKTEEMVNIGARIIRESAKQQTAEAARIEAGGQASQLDTAVGNLADAIRQGLRDMALFVGANPDEIEFDLNRQYWIQSVDPQTASAIIMLGDAGLAGPEDQHYMIKTGRIGYKDGRTLEEVQADIATRPI